MIQHKLLNAQGELENIHSSATKFNVCNWVEEFNSYFASLGYIYTNRFKFKL